MNHLLKRGSKGNDVKAVQTALKIEADGIFGVITEFAVKTLSLTASWETRHGRLFSRLSM